MFCPLFLQPHTSAQPAPAPQSSGCCQAPCGPSAVRGEDRRWVRGWHLCANESVCFPSAPRAQSVRRVKKASRKIRYSRAFGGLSVPCLTLGRVHSGAPCYLSVAAGAAGSHRRPVMQAPGRTGRVCSLQGLHPLEPALTCCRCGGLLRPRHVRRHLCCCLAPRPPCGLLKLLYKGDVSPSLPHGPVRARESSRVSRGHPVRAQEATQVAHWLPSFGPGLLSWHFCGRLCAAQGTGRLK